MTSPQTPADMTTLLAFEAGQRDAVAKVVAWLREQYPATCDMADAYVCEAIDRIADAIERGATHTNTIESFWSLIKRAWYGSHHHYSRKYMPLYIAEACFKYNRRKSATAFDSSLRLFVGASA